MSLSDRSQKSGSRSASSKPLKRKFQPPASISRSRSPNDVHNKGGHRRSQSQSVTRRPGSRGDSTLWTGQQSRPQSHELSRQYSRPRSELSRQRSRSRQLHDMHDEDKARGTGSRDRSLSAEQRDREQWRSRSHSADKHGRGGVRSRERSHSCKSRYRSRSREPINRSGRASGRSDHVPHLCFFYVIGKCRKGDSCPDRHPPEDDCKRILSGMQRTMCRYGNECRRRECIFKHPDERVRRLEEEC